MAVTLEVMRSRVRVKLNEMDARRVARDVVEIDGAISDAYILLGSRIPAPRLYTPNAFTIAANANTFRLPASGAEYAGDVRIQLVSDQRFIVKMTREEIESLRDGDIATVGIDRPRFFSLYEESDQDVQGDCWPRSKDAELCNLFAALVVSDLRDATDMDAANITFSRYGSTALVFYAAASLVAGMTADDLALRRLNPNIAALWLKDADRLLYAEEVRRHAAEDSGRTQRWVS